MTTTKTWTAQQQAIFSWFKNSGASKNLVVRARAGTGKTTTIVEAVKYAPEGKILLAAFNKEIQNELSARVSDDRVQCKTLHSLGFGFIRYAWKNVSIDNYGERAMKLARGAAPTAPENIVRLISDLHTKVREVAPFARTASDVAEVAYRFDLLPDSEETVWTDEKVFYAALTAVREASRRTNVIDFADMIFLPLVCDLVRPWFSLVVVDEAQDMTVAQLTLAVRSCKRDGRIVVVGDDWQAIYAFRGADAGSLDRLKEELKATELGLTTTYRCPKSHVALCQSIVPDFTAAAINGEGTIAWIQKGDLFGKVQPGDFVISRTNAPLVEVCLGLLRAGVRATIRGRDIGKGIVALINKFRAVDVNDLLTQLKGWANKESDRAKSRGAKGEARLTFVQQQVELIDALCVDLDRVADLKARVETLFSDEGNAKVVCTTVHKVKGLEATNTFVLEGTLRQSSREEKAISYVALSRSKQSMTFVKGFEKNSKELQG